MDNAEKMIYLDHAATGPMWPEAVAAMLPFFTERFGNPSGVCRPAQEARRSVEEARRKIAQALGAVPPETIYFTGCGTESDNLALTGYVNALRSVQPEKPGHIVVGMTEHPAVLETARALMRDGVFVSFARPDENGVITPEALEEVMRPDTVLVSIMYANNEVGTVQPVSELAAVSHAYGAVFHTDAVQAFGHVPIDPVAEGVDLLSASGHKFGGPKGVGFLYVREGLKLSPILNGGSQERHLRAGTLNVPGIVGMGEAARLCAVSMGETATRIAGLRNLLEERVLAKLPDVTIQAKNARRLPGHSSMTIPGVTGENMVLMLNLHGICISAGSACTSGDTKPSHVLSAMGLSDRECYGTIRISLGRGTTREEIETTAATIVEEANKLRKMLPE
ncbi:MAG: cysteine desulfurase [Lachnospiraceae bacterium]|nr:cysteine desulfurase [Lachnospiraceae bacterium]